MLTSAVLFTLWLANHCYKLTFGSLLLKLMSATVRPVAVAGFSNSHHKGDCKGASPFAGARGRASGGCKSGSSHLPLLPAAAGGKR